jgi:hypothetical protein
MSHQRASGRGVAGVFFWFFESTYAKGAQIGATSSAGLAYESGLKVREPDIITPLVDHCRRQLVVVTASIV